MPGLVSSTLEATFTADSETEMMSSHSAATRYKIIRFRPMGVREAYKSLTAPTGEQLSRLRDIAESFGLQDVVTV